MNRVDERFPSMGTRARVRLESATLDDGELERLAAAVRERIDEVERRLTRFSAGSDLSRLNSDPRERVPVDGLVAAFARAAAWAHGVSGGLVDATLLRALERTGYASSRAGLAPAPLDDALAAAPARRPAHARTEGPGFSVAHGSVCRPAGVRLDAGGTGKGLAADWAASLLPAGVRYAISCGGDMAAGGGPWEIAVTGARGGREVHRLRLAGRAGVATSGIHERLWRRADGCFAHHLLDPSTGEPAWTGLVAATAVGRNALEAEVLAKTALLRGPDGARRVLRRRGGVLQHEDGHVEVLTAAPVVRLPPPGAHTGSAAA